MNLIICTSPLQILIARKIIDLYPEKQFFGLLITKHKNDKFCYYYNKLEEKCIESEYILLNSGIKRTLKSIELKVKKKRYFDTVFIASINVSFIHILLSNINFKNLNTFDDGLANITGTGIYYQNHKISYHKRILRKFFGIKYDQTIIKNNTSNHFTIYKNEKNITPKTTYISLLEIDKHNNTRNNKEETVRFFVAQNLKEINISQQALEIIMQQYKIDYYFPHPKENYHIDGVQYIKTRKVFEDFILSELSYKNIEIFTFFSSVALNLKDIKNITITCFFSSKIPKHFQSSYSIFKKYNIPCIDIDTDF